MRTRAHVNCRCELFLKRLGSNCQTNVLMSVCLFCGQPEILPFPRLSKVTQCYLRILKVTQGYPRLPKVNQDYPKGYPRLPKATQGYTWLTKALHELAWACACMKSYELACSSMSLYAVPFFVWTAHKNFALLVVINLPNLWSDMKVSSSTVRMWVSLILTQATVRFLSALMEVSR